MKPADKAKTAERTAKPAAARVLLLVPSRTYRAADFLTAAARLGLDLVVGSDGALPLGGRPVVHADPSDPRGSASRLVAATGPVDAVVAADTPMLVLAAAVAARMGLAHNPVGARRSGPAGVPGRARRGTGRFAAAGGGPGRVPVRGQGGVAQRQPGDPASRRTCRRGGRGPGGSGGSWPQRGGPALNPCSSRSTCPGRS